MSRRKGFTLVELIVAIAVMAILASVVTTAGVAIANSVQDSRNKTLVQSIYGNMRSVSKQLNTGATVYNTDTPEAAANAIGKLLERASSIKYVGSTSSTSEFAIRDITQLVYNENYTTAKPNEDKSDGLYIVVRHANPECTYPMVTNATNEATSAKNAQWWVEAIYMRRDKKLYTMTRFAPEVSVE